MSIGEHAALNSIFLCTLIMRSGEILACLYNEAQHMCALVTENSFSLLYNSPIKMMRGETGMKRRTVIIGGVAGGATTAARLRRRDEEREILLLEKGEYISYANCGLPYYIGDVIQNRESLFLQNPEVMKQRFHIDIRTSNEVTAIVPDKKRVVIKNLKSGESYEEHYDDLVIATGSSPFIPPVPGIDSPGIFTLWTIPDTDEIKRLLEEKEVKKAAVIGGGFIGLEMAENLHRLGIQVSVIEMENQVMAPLDYEMAELLHENLALNDVELILGDGAASFSRKGEQTVITLKSGNEITVDLALLSIGVRPNSKLAKEAGLKVNQKGGIVVDSCMKTSDPHIYAVGDVAEVTHYVLGTPAMIPLAGPANKEARICADNLAGDNKEYKGSLGTSVAKIFDYTAAVTGVNEKTLKALGKKKGEDYFTVLINQKSHAGYYPGSAPLTLKLIFDQKGVILGAQIIGQEGVDKRIDTIAAIMGLKGAIYDLEELELAYAPPFSSAKDPVNMLGFTAENVLRGFVSLISGRELDQIADDKILSEDTIILDVTEEVERMVYQIPGSYSIPLGQLRERMGELDPEKLIIVYCAIGVRAYNGARILMQNGFERVKVLEGGLSFYKSLHRDAIERDENRMEPAMKQDISSKKTEIKTIDCCGLQCPGPIMKVHESIQQMEQGDILEVSATDMGFARDIASWCKQTGNTLVAARRQGAANLVQIQKGLSPLETGGQISKTPPVAEEGKTIVVFSGDMDKVLASFIIANGAAAMGRPVTMFFTFWGLNVLRKPKKQHVKKTAIEKMFGIMMPRGSKKLTLSKMNMGGMGTRMMKQVMKAKNVDSLDVLMQQALKNGVKFVACTMSMDVMGIKPEEIIDGVTFAGVASYLGDAEHSNVNLFI